MTKIQIVGAGLAGLRCAEQLIAAGQQVQVYEASDAVGGRARTDQIDGFLLDRGFQVLLTAYPEARRAFDNEALDLGEFEPGALVRLNGKFSPLTDPVRRPAQLLAAVGSPVIGLADKLRLGKMRQEIVSASPQEILGREDRTALESLQARGFSENAIERFFRPFFGGVFIDPDLATSSRMLEIFFRCFSVGSAALPDRGMGQLAEGIANKLPEGTVRLEAPVREVRADGVRRDDGEWEEAAAVVVATDERAAASLAGIPGPGPGRDLPGGGQLPHHALPRGPGARDRHPAGGPPGLGDDPAQHAGQCQRALQRLPGQLQHPAGVVHVDPAQQQRQPGELAERCRWHLPGQQRPHPVHALLRVHRPRRDRSVPRGGHRRCDRDLNGSGHGRLHLLGVIR